MDRKTFLGAIRRLVISHVAISKSIWGNLNNLTVASRQLYYFLSLSLSSTRPPNFAPQQHSPHSRKCPSSFRPPPPPSSPNKPNHTHLLKNRGIRSPSDRLAGVVPPKLGVPPCCRGIEMCGFIGDGVARTLVGKLRRWDGGWWILFLSLSVGKMGLLQKHGHTVLTMRAWRRQLAAVGGVKRIAAHDIAQGFFVRVVRRNLICFQLLNFRASFHLTSPQPFLDLRTILSLPPDALTRSITSDPPPHRNHAHLKERPCSSAPPPPPSIPQPRSPIANHHRCRSTASTRKPTRPGRAPPSRPTATPSKRPRPCQRYVNRPGFPRSRRVWADGGVVGGFSARIV